MQYLVCKFEPRQKKRCRMIFKKNKFIKLFLVAFLYLCQTGYGQIVGGDNSHMIEEGWISSSAVGILESMKLKYTRPDGFKEAYKYSECFTPGAKLSLTLGCIDNKLYSEEEDFIIFMPVRPLLSPEVIARWKKRTPNFSYDIDSLHIKQVKHIIKTWYGDMAGDKWENYVDYYPPVEAKAKFNADTVITFSINLTKDEFYKNRYKYLDVFLIQKNGRGFIAFYSFYDEKGKSNLESYRDKLESVLQFEQ